MKDKSTLDNILSQISVEVPLVGINNVGPQWKESNYIPDYNKFYFIINGTGWIKVGDNELNPIANQLCLMPEGIKQSYSVTNPSNPFIKYWVHFKATIWDMNLFDIIEVPLYTDIRNTFLISTLFDQMFRYFLTKDCFIRQTIINSYMKQIIYFYLEEVGIENIKLKKSSDISRIVSIINYIEQNLDKDLSLEALAEFAHLQPNYFISYFKKYMHVSPMQYVNNKRISHSVHLLKHTEHKIKVIANQCGYQNELYFSKIFKKAFGITPSEFRKLN